MKVILVLALAGYAAASFSARVDTLADYIVGIADLLNILGEVTGGTGYLGDLQVGDSKLTGVHVHGIGSMQRLGPAAAVAEDNNLAVSTHVFLNRTSISVRRIESPLLNASDVTLSVGKNLLAIKWIATFSEDGTCTDAWDRFELLTLEDLTLTQSEGPSYQISPQLADQIKALINSYIASEKSKIASICSIHPKQ